VKQPLRLLANELDYAQEAFREVLGESSTELQWHEHLAGFTLHPPEDLLRRFEYLPPELRQEGSELKLTVDRPRVMDALEKARQDERKWPEWQLFWEQHPVAEWLDDRVLGKFARHEAPVLRLTRGVAADERVVVFQGVLSNERSQPVIVDWFGVRFRGRKPGGTSSLEDLLSATGLAQGLPNPGGALSVELEQELRSLLPSAVEHARDLMLELRKSRAEEIGAPLREELRKVKMWHDRRLEDLDRFREAMIERRGKLRADQESDFEAKKKEVTELHQARRRWINEGMRTVSRPYLRVAAVLIPREAR
jgi:hypothetical protein